MEGELKRLLQLAKEAGLLATLTFVVKGGKTRARLEVDLDSEAAPPSSSTPASALALADVVDDGLEVPSSKGPHQGLRQLFQKVKLDDLLDPLGDL